MSRSYDQWQDLILEALGDEAMSTREVADAYNKGLQLEYGEDHPLVDELWVSSESVYGYMQRMVWAGILSREPTGVYRPRWRYFKTERPVTGRFAEIVKGVELAAPE